MIPEKLKEILRKQHYGLAGRHSAVQICRWTKKSLIDEGFCYKQKFYGIQSHRCCQMSPAAVFCQNKCQHCWRAIEYTLGAKLNKNQADKPKKIIDESIKQQRILLSGFKGNKKINLKKFNEAQEPMQFAISLSGEPTIYPYIAELIKELRKRKKTSFLVTNGLFPKRLKELEKKDALPTQLYISTNAADEKDYKKFMNPQIKNAWAKHNESLELMKKLDTRTVLRFTLVKGMNMSKHEGYAKLIKKANPKFVEIKGYMSVGFARQRLGYEKMPTYSEVKEFAEKISLLTGLKILDEKNESRVFLLGKNKENMKI